MSEVTSIRDVVTRLRAESAQRSAPKRETSRRETAKPQTAAAPPSPGKMLWGAMLVLGALSLAPMAGIAAQGLASYSLAQSDDADIRDILSAPMKDGASADYYEALSELALSAPDQNLVAARAAAVKAVELDRTRPFVWASLAWMHTIEGGVPTPDALAALKTSMDQCPLCSEELVRWRFNFVLTNWDGIPEALRTRAFEQADLLRWTGANAEFLGEMRLKAMSAGIPFDDYRAAVDTPVRAWDIGEKPDVEVLEMHPQPANAPRIELKGRLAEAG